MIQQYTDENLNIWKDIFHFIDQPFQAHLNELALNAAAKKWPPPFKVSNNSTFQYWVYFRVIRPGGFIFDNVCLKYLRFFKGQKEGGVTTIYAVLTCVLPEMQKLYVFGRKRSLIMKPASLTAAKALQIRPTICKGWHTNNISYQILEVFPVLINKNFPWKRGNPENKASVYPLYLKCTLCPWLKKWKQENVYSPITTWKRAFERKGLRTVCLATSVHTLNCPDKSSFRQ